MLLLRLAGGGSASTGCGSAFNSTIDGSRVLQCAIQSYSVLQIVCLLPPALGSTLQVFIRRTWIDLPSNVRYGMPVIASISPSRLPTDGGEITIVGHNFGNEPCDDTRLRSEVTLMMVQPPTATPSDALLWSSWSAFDVIQRRFNRSLAMSSVPCQVLHWSPTRINCTVPAGIDGSVTVTVRAGGQNVSVAGLLGFHAPVLSAAVTVSAADPSTALDASPVTRGGSWIRVNGSDIPGPQWPMVIVVGTTPCDIIEALRTGTSAVCAVPAGAGSSVPLTMYSPVQQSANALQLSYAAPEVYAVETPSGVSVNGGFLLLVTGKVHFHTTVLDCMHM
jgi:hypothetical protein